MACGLKKQNKPEGGVHLTERTCSPYNPIIKLIVDDCLGLPIYPVSSIDAVIDEDGNTLRKLLEDLLDKINSQSGDITDDLEAIRTILEGLDDLYAPNSIQKLVWAISAMTNEQTVTSETPRYDGQTTVPKIVKAVIDLQDLMELILQGGGSLADLQEQINSLSLIVNRISECDVTLSSLSIRLPIIQKIKEILLELGILQDNAVVTPNLNGTLRQKVAWLKNQLEGVVSRLESLEEQVGALPDNAARLDENVLLQKPLSFIGDEDMFKTLRTSDYPPDSIDILTENTIGDRRYNKQRLEYIGFLPDVSADSTSLIEILYDLYPFCHTDLSMGFPLFYKAKGGGENDPLIPLLNSNEDLLRIGDGFVGAKDLDVIVKAASIKSFTYPLNTQNVNDIGVLYMQVEVNSFVVVGDFNNDGESHLLQDVNSLIDFIINKNIQTSNSIENIHLLPANNTSINSSHWLAYYAENSTYPICYYPCIEGKIYTDTFTGDLYRFSEGKMYKVSENSIYEFNGLYLKKSSEFIDDEHSLGPYSKVKVTDYKTCAYCKNVEEINALNEGDLFLVDNASDYILLSLTHNNELPGSINAPTSQSPQYRYNISAVTNCVNLLLNNQATNCIKDFTSNNIVGFLNTLLGLEDILDSLDLHNQKQADIYSAIDAIIHRNETESYFLEITDFDSSLTLDTSLLNSLFNIASSTWRYYTETSRPTVITPGESQLITEGNTKGPLYLWYLQRTTNSQGEVEEVLKSTVIPGRIVELNFGKFYDLNDSGRFEIGDITLLINNLLLGSPVIEKSLSLFPVVYVKTKNIRDLSDLDTDAGNPRYNIKGSLLYDYANDRVICTINERGEARSIEDSISLTYDAETTSLLVVKNGLITNSIDLGSIVAGLVQAST